MKKKISIEVKITDRCNQKCFHCVNDDLVESGAVVHWRLFIEKLKKWVEGREASLFEIPEVRMTGGEPMLYPDIIAEISRACSELGIRSGINTNGTLLDSPGLESLKEAGTSIVKISFDGLSRATYGKMRDAKFSPDEIIRGIDAAVKLGFGVILRYTLSRHNQSELLTCYQVARDFGAAKFQVKPLVEAGRARASNAFLTKDEVDRSIVELENFVSGDELVPEILCWLPRQSSRLRYSVCSSLNKIYLFTNLRVTICNYVPVTRYLGDLTAASLEDVLRARKVDAWKSPEGQRIIMGCPNLAYFAQTT
ncbi:MAG: radical SAM protein [Acidobacteriota bacterium]